MMTIKTVTSYSDLTGTGFERVVNIKSGKVLARFYNGKLLRRHV